MFLDHAIATLKSHGQKITKTRLWILEQFATLHAPLNPYELIEQHPDAKIDITTIYRNLELFEQLGLVHKIASLWWYMPCTHDHADCHHVHDMIICNNCHHITETHIDTKTKQFLWLGVWPVELSGQCISCEQITKT